MRSNDLTHARRDLAAWGEPIIADRLIDYYSRALKGQTSMAQALAIHHRRLWRHLFATQSAEAQANRGELQKLGKLVGMRPSVIDDVDQLVIDELMHVIMARFHHSPALACDYSMTLLEIAESLVETRLRAA